MEDKHCLTFDVGVGYSSIFNTKALMFFDEERGENIQIGSGKNLGLAGGNLQIGYEWQHNLWLVHTGIEIAFINNIAKVSFDRVLGTPYRYDKGTYGLMKYFDISDFKEVEQLGVVSVPIMAGYKFLTNYYFLAGAKIGFPIIHTATTTNTVNRWLASPNFDIGSSATRPIDNAPAHGVYPENFNIKKTWDANFSVQLSAEIGVLLHQLIQKPKGKKNVPTTKSKNKKTPLPFFYRIALFVDYGLIPCTKTKNAEIAYVSETTNDIAFNPYINTGKKANPFLIGVKFAMQLQLNRPKKVVPPTSTLEIYATDKTTQQPVQASLAIRNDATGREQKAKLSNKGYLRRSTAVGNYTVAASADNYFPDTLHYSINQLGDNASIHFNLQPVPKPEIKVEPPKEEPIIFNDIVVEKGKTITLDERFLRFATGKVEVLKESKEALDALYQLLADNPEIRIRIVGHTDNVGSNKDNLALSHGRANAVKKELVNRGIDASRIETDGKGEEEPIADNNTEEGRAKNRRVELSIL